MNTTAKIALAASGGYFLGRTKKMKLAAMLALFLAGQKLPKSPLELVQQGAGALSKNEKFAELSQQVTGSLLEAGKVAASRSAERWLTGVGEKLRDGIPGPDSEGAAARADEPEDNDEGTDEGTDDQDSEQESEQNARTDDAQADDDAEDQATDEADSGSDSESAAKPRSAAKKTDNAAKTGSAGKKATSSRPRSTRSSGPSSQRSGSARGA